MRISRPKLRKTSNRRAHRPDQRVYRTLRLNRKRRGPSTLIGWMAFVAVLVTLGVWLVVRH